MNIVINELSVTAIDQAKRQLEQYRRQLDEKLELLVSELAEIGVQAAIAEVKVDTGALRSSIRAERHAGGNWLVIAESPYVAYVEFGTGVVGEGTYPKELPIPWEYDQMRTPEAHDRIDPTKWYYYDDEGYRYSTRGQIAGAFMAKASDEMRNNVLKIAREVFA